MGAISTRPITIEEFDKLDLPQDRKWELHSGELVEMPFASPLHNSLQNQIAFLLQAAFPALVVRVELGFQVETTINKRYADVGVITKQRRREELAKGILSGAPELVVEVLSPSNTVMDMKEYQRLCFQHGTQVFLMVNPANNTVDLYRDPAKADSVWKLGDTLPLSLLGVQANISIDAFFAGITVPEASAE